MENLKIAVCEDEIEDRKTLVDYLNQYLKEKHLDAAIDSFSSGEAFLKEDCTAYHLVFLDIYMEGINGMATAKKLLQRNGLAKIVFCSSSKDFAVESYEISAFYYLVKPLEKEKLWRVLDRFFMDIVQLKTITVRVARTQEYVYLKDILYIESDNKKAILHMTYGDLEVSMPFAYFYQQLKENDFVRPIRYALVAVSKIVGVPSNFITLINGVKIPVSKKEKAHVMDVFAAYKWQTSLNNFRENAEGEIKE